MTSPRPLTGRQRLFLVLLFLASLALRLPRLDAPFTGLCGLDAAIYAQEFRNAHRHGFAGTGGWPCRLPGRWQPGEPLDHHATHWPVALWLNVLFQKAVGVGAGPMPEWSVRAVSILAGALTPLLLFFIVRRLSDGRRAWIAATIAAVLPSAVYFPHAVSCHLPLAVCLSLAAFLAYLRWRMAEGGWADFAVILLVSLGCLWEAFYLPVLLIGYHALTGGGRRLRFGALLALAVGLAAAGLWVWLRLLPGSESLLGRASERSQLPPVATYLARVVLRLLLYGTLPGMLLLTLWMARILRRPSSLAGPWPLWIALCLVWGVCDLVLLPDYWCYHPYAVYSLVPVLACAGAEVLTGMGRRSAGLLLLLLAFQSGWLVQRRYAQDHGYPLTQELSASARGRLAFGDDLLATFRVDGAHTAFYADALVVSGVDGPERLEAVRALHPGRRFRWLVAIPPERLLALASVRGGSGAKLSGFLPSCFWERPRYATAEETLRAFGVGPGEGVFRAWLDARFPCRDDGVFLWYDLERPLARRLEGAPSATPAPPPASRSGPRAAPPPPP